MYDRQGPLARSLLVVVCLTVATAENATAQGDFRGVRGDGLAGSFTALAGGAFAISVDPAALAERRGDPRDDWHSAPLWVLPSVAVRMGMEPVTLGSFTRYSGRTVPHDVRSRWLGEVTAGGGERGVAAADLTVFAYRRGRFGLRWATSAGARVRLNPDAAEVLLFGNSGRTGSPGAYVFDGSLFDAWSASTISLAAGARLEEFGVGAWADGVSVGVTASWTAGHAFATGRDAGTSVGADPVTLDGVFPVVYSHAAVDNGHGLGLDAAIRVRRDAWTVVLHAKNLISTFAWRADVFDYRPGVALLGPDTSFTYSPPLSLSQAPSSIRDRIASFGFGRTLTAGAAKTVGSTSVVTAEAACTWDARDGTHVDGCRFGTGVERRWGDRLRASGGSGVEEGALALGIGGTVRLARILVDVSTYRRFGGASETRWSVGVALGDTFAKRN